MIQLKFLKKAKVYKKAQEVLKKKKEYIGKIATYVATTKQDQFNKAIKELELVEEQRTEYDRPTFWHNTLGSFKFDSKGDQEFVKLFEQAIRNREIEDDHIDYIAGKGKWKGIGLLDYVKYCQQDTRKKDYERLEKDVK